MHAAVAEGGVQYIYFLKWGHHAPWFPLVTLAIAQYLLLKGLTNCLHDLTKIMISQVEILNLVHMNLICSIS